MHVVALLYLIVPFFICVSTEEKYCCVSFQCVNSVNIKGWRSEIYRLSSFHCGYYESSTDSIKYEDVTLHCCLWFRDPDKMRLFVEDVTSSHNSFCRHLSVLQVPTLDLSMKRPPTSLTPVMTSSYNASDSKLPDLTEANDYQSNNGSVVSVSTPGIFVRLIEDAQVFEELKPCSCHIADKALYPDYDHDSENRLYMSQDQHSRFDGRQTNDSLPHFGIYFVSFDGKEVVEFEDEYDKVTVGSEIPYPGVERKIRFKKGSDRRDGVMHTFLHATVSFEVHTSFGFEIHRHHEFVEEQG